MTCRPGSGSEHCCPKPGPTITPAPLSCTPALLCPAPCLSPSQDLRRHLLSTKGSGMSDGRVWAEEGGGRRKFRGTGGLPGSLTFVECLLSARLCAGCSLLVLLEWTWCSRCKWKKDSAFAAGKFIDTPSRSVEEGGDVSGRGLWVWALALLVFCSATLIKLLNCSQLWFVYFLFNYLIIFFIQLSNYISTDSWIFISFFGL